MSGDQENAKTGNKTVTVKWAGKTITLGTFAVLDADEKCARAKALTRTWRSTRPKPTKEWVTNELERLGIRVVNGRHERKPGVENNSVESTLQDCNANQPHLSLFDGVETRPTAIRRNSSLGISLINENQSGCIGSYDPMFRVNDPAEIFIPPHRPYIGGGAAAAHEAWFYDHHTRKCEEQRHQPRSQSLKSVGLGNCESAISNDQHYEMLKLHHIKLLKEMQKTTLIMNSFQHQQMDHQHNVNPNAIVNNLKIEDVFNPKAPGQSLGASLLSQQGMGLNIPAIASHCSSQLQLHPRLMNDSTHCNDDSLTNIVHSDSAHNGAQNSKNDNGDQKRLRDHENNVQNKRQNRDDSGLESI